MVSSNVEVGAYATVDGVLSVLRTMPRLRPDGSMGDFSYEASIEYWEAVENTFQSWRLLLIIVEIYRTPKTRHDFLWEVFESCGKHLDGI